MTSIATLTIEMAANVARLQQDMNNAQRVVGDAMQRMQAASDMAARAMGVVAVALGGTAFASSIRNVLDMADALDDLAEKTGIGTKALSALRYAGEVNGTSTEALSMGLNKLAKNMAGAASGGRDQAAAFAALGVKVTDTSGNLRSSDKVLLELADRFASFRDGPAKAALAMEVFGKSGTDMIPLLNQGSVGIENLSNEADRLGALVGEEFAANAAKFNDNLKRLKLSSDGFFMAVAEEGLPTINRLMEAFVDSKNSGGGFADFIGQALKVAIETVAVLAADLVFVLQGVWRELSAIGHQAAAIATLDFSKASEIRSKLIAENLKSVEDLKKFELTVTGIQSDKGRGNAYLDPRLISRTTQSIASKLMLGKQMHQALQIL